MLRPLQFSRVNNAGPIEALGTSVIGRINAAFSRVNNAGPIEAPKRAQHTRAARAGFSRVNNAGPIEAFAGFERRFRLGFVFPREQRGPH